MGRTGIFILPRPSSARRVATKFVKDPLAGLRRPLAAKRIPRLPGRVEDKPRSPAPVYESKKSFLLIKFHRDSVPRTSRILLVLLIHSRRKLDERGASKADPGAGDVPVRPGDSGERQITGRISFRGDTDESNRRVFAISDEKFHYAGEKVRGGGRWGRRRRRRGLDKESTVACGQTVQGNYRVNGPRKTSSRYS